jgi:hypothetical protein
VSGHPLCVTVQRDQWRSLPRDIRIRLVESGDLPKFQDSILVPAWLESYSKLKATMAGYLLRELGPAVRSRLRARTGADFENFLKRHDSFEHRWAATSALLVGH